MAILPGHDNVNVVGPLESQEQAGYMGPEAGPFQCQNCRHFQGDGQDCEIVEGPIQAEGCCNEFEPAQSANSSSPAGQKGEGY